MPFPVSEEWIAAAELHLGRRLPPQLRERLMRENGGGDYRVRRGGSSVVELWDHETGETLPVEVQW